MFPDYGADPVWAKDGMVDLDTLPISASLRARLRAWNSQWEDLLGVAANRYAIVDEDAHKRWRDEGAELARVLRTELGRGYRVSYQP